MVHRHFQMLCRHFSTSGGVFVDIGPGLLKVARLFPSSTGLFSIIGRPFESGGRPFENGGRPFENACHRI
jgi:hypothetical protein